MPKNKIIGFGTILLFFFILQGFSYKPKNPTVAPPKEPLIFGKPLSTLVQNPTTLRLSNQHPILQELEIGIVIGKSGSNIDPSKSLSYIGGYFLCFDFTSKMLLELRKDGKDFFPCKASDNFTPCSNFVEKSDVDDPKNIDFKLHKNGVEVMIGNTGDLLFDFQNQIHLASKICTLNEGDLLLTGTPEGVGLVENGDHIQGEMSFNGKKLTKLDFKVELI